MRERELEEIEEAFRALGNINRLKLLVQLQSPQGYSEIELTPSRPSDAGSQDRAISRQAVRNHVEELLDLGVVTESKPEGRKRRFVVDRPRLYALVEQMRRLATVEPTVSPEGPTMELDASGPPPQPAGPHLALVRGVREGETFPLEDCTEDEPAVIGRSPDNEIPLDYDAYVSGRHALVLEGDDGYLLEDLPENKNGTLLNWRKMKSGATAPLSAGDVVGVGRSLLVFRE